MVSKTGAGRHVALYLRISDDKEGHAKGVAAQEVQGRAYAALTWPGLPVVVYCDNDLSAAKSDVVRPEFDRLRAAVADGLVAHIWAAEQSRLARQKTGPNSWFALAAELDAAGISEVHTLRDGIVRVDSEVADIKAVLAHAEVRKLTKRINDRLDVNAAAGVPPGSLPYGYRHAVVTMDGGPVKTYAMVPEQAAAIRQAADWLLAGWSLAAITAALTAQGLTGNHHVSDGHGGRRPGRLSPASVRRMLTSPSVAGLRQHRGVIVGRGNWQPILDEPTYRACQARLAKPRVIRRSDGRLYPVPAPSGRSSGRKYLLTGGLAVCGVCGAAMVATIKQLKGGAARGGRDAAYYLCHPSKGGKACTGILADGLEAHVMAELFAALDRPEFLAMVADDSQAGRRAEIETRLAAIEGQRAELARMWASQQLTGAEWAAARDSLTDAETGLRIELSDCQAPPALAGIADAQAAWPAMTLDERRELLRLFVSRVTVSRAQPGTRTFDSGRVAIDWAAA